MKSLLSATCIVLLFSFSAAYAAKLVSEPTLPADIEVAWEKREPITCTKFPGKHIVGMQYIQRTQGLVRSIIVFTLNGQKIDQREWSKFEGSTPIQTRYVKNTLENSWYAYAVDEANESGARMLLELGLTKEELVSCNQ